jgi:hypothetical protein
VGKSLPPPAVVDLVGSYARRRGEDVEIVLSDPQFAVTTPALVLTKGSTSVDGLAELVDAGSARRLVGRFPRRRLTNGIWSLALRSDERSDEPIDARLLVQGDRPLVLLWGAKTQPSVVPSEQRGAAARKARAAAAAGRAVDQVLRVLPPEQAVKVRSSVRATARKVLS